MDLFTRSFGRYPRMYFNGFLALFLFAQLLMIPTLAEARHSSSFGTTRVLSYYLQQEFGTTELQMVPAARAPVNGTFTGFGQEMVYEFVMTTGPNETTAEIMGYVRGTAIAVNNTASSTIFFVNNVVHYDYGGEQGTLSQQGEADFSAASWEFCVVGGTGVFRYAKGYNVGTQVSMTRTPAGRSHVVTQYDAHFCLGGC